MKPETSSNTPQGSTENPGTEIAYRRIWIPDKEIFNADLINKAIGVNARTINFPWEGWVWQLGGAPKGRTRLAIYPEQRMARAQFLDCFDEAQTRERLIDHIAAVPLKTETLLSIVSARGSRYSILTVARDGTVIERHATRPLQVDLRPETNGILLAEEAAGPVLSVNEAATRLGVHRTTVQRLVREGSLEAVKRGWHLFIHVDSLEELKRSRLMN